MGAARLFLFTTISVLGVLWTAAWASTWGLWGPGSGEDDLGVGMLVVIGFGIGHCIALALAVMASILAANALGRSAARTMLDYVTLGASSALAVFIFAYLGFFAGLWGT